MNERAAKPRASKPLTWVSLAVMLLNAIGLLLVGPMLAVMNGWIAGTFNEYGAELPGLTVFFLNTPWWVWCVVFLPLAITVFVLEFAVRSKPATITLNLLIGGVLMVFLAVYVLAMALPLFSMLAQRTV